MHIEKITALSDLNLNLVNIKKTYKYLGIADKYDLEKIIKNYKLKEGENLIIKGKISKNKKLEYFMTFDIAKEMFLDFYLKFGIKEAENLRIELLEFEQKLLSKNHISTVQQPDTFLQKSEPINFDCFNYSPSKVKDVITKAKSMLPSSIFTTSSLMQKNVQIDSEKLKKIEFNLLKKIILNINLLKIKGDFAYLDKSFLREYDIDFLIQNRILEKKEKETLYKFNFSIKAFIKQKVTIRELNLNVEVIDKFLFLVKNQFEYFENLDFQEELNEVCRLLRAGEKPIGVIKDKSFFIDDNKLIFFKLLGLKDSELDKIKSEILELITFTQNSKKYKIKLDLFRDYRLFLKKYNLSEAVKSLIKAKNSDEGVSLKMKINENL